MWRVQWRCCRQEIEVNDSGEDFRSRDRVRDNHVGDLRYELIGIRGQGAVGVCGRVKAADKDGCALQGTDRGRDGTRKVIAVVTTNVALDGIKEGGFAVSEITDVRDLNGGAEETCYLKAEHADVVLWNRGYKY